MSLHGPSDWRAINKSYRGGHITPEHLNVTHAVPHEDVRANTHTHTYMLLEHRWKSVHTLPRLKEEVGRCWCYDFTWLQVEKHMIFQNRCVELLFFCKVPEKLYCLTCFKSHPKLFCWASTFSFMLYKPWCHLHVIWNLNQQELKYLREKKNALSKLNMFIYLARRVKIYLLRDFKQNFKRYIRFCWTLFNGSCWERLFQQRKGCLVDCGLV